MTRARILAVSAVGLAGGVALDLVVQYARFPGWGAVLGFGGCVLLTYLAKGLVGPVLQRPWDHYPEDAIPEVQDDVGPDATREGARHD